MIITMQRGAHPDAITHVVERIEELGLTPRVITGVERTVIAVIGDERGKVQLENLEVAPGVEKIDKILQPFKLVSITSHPDHRSTVVVGGATFGNGQFPVTAGPCSVENEEQIMSAARSVKTSGARLLRGGAFKPRSSPYSFQGLGEDGLKLLAQARAETGLGIVTEVMDAGDLDLILKYADCLQIGARNMANFSLLKAVGKTSKPIILKRGMSATIEEWLMAAEYILAEGNPDVILCERGIRSFDGKYTRNVFDLAAILVAKQLSHLPVIADPSHGAGVNKLIHRLALAAVPAGADGLMIEVHPNPEKAMSDGPQSLTPEQFAALMAALPPYLALENRTL